MWSFKTFPSLTNCILVFVAYSYADARRKIFNTIKTSGHSSLEKYTSHFIWKGSKGLREVLSMRGELETEQNCNILTPTLLAIAAFLSRSPGLLNRDMFLIPASSHQLISTSCRRGYIIIWHPPTSCERHICTQFNPLRVKVIPWSLDIFDRIHCDLHRCISSFDSLAGVNMLHFYTWIFHWQFHNTFSQSQQ